MFILQIDYSHACNIAEWGCDKLNITLPSWRLAFEDRLSLFVSPVVFVKNVIVGEMLSYC